MDIFSKLNMMLDRFEIAISTSDLQSINHILYLIYRGSRNVYNYVLKSKKSVFEKSIHIQKISAICDRLVKLISRNIKSIAIADIYVLIETIGMLYRAGCQLIIDKLFPILYGLSRKDLNSLAHLADIMLECGCVDLAFKVLTQLLGMNYNCPAVLVNLAITSYMLGNPREAKRYAEMYENLTKRRLALKTSLAIVLGDVEYISARRNKKH